jgi:F-type H+-transporting ATPase subunit epsilon
MAKKFHFLLVSPEKNIFDSDVEYVGLPVKDGEIGIMADHLPLVSIINPGAISIKDGSGKDHLLSTGGGFVEVKDNIAKAFVQSAEFADSIDEQRVIAGIKQAQELMSSVEDEISLADASSILERNIARLKTIERRKKYRNTH